MLLHSLEARANTSSCLHVLKDADVHIYAPVAITAEQIRHGEKHPVHRETETEGATISHPPASETLCMKLSTLRCSCLLMPLQPPRTVPLFEAFTFAGTFQSCSLDLAHIGVDMVVTLTRFFPLLRGHVSVKYLGKILRYLLGIQEAVPCLDFYP